MAFLFNRGNSAAITGRADYDPTLPSIVTQMLRLSGSQYERDKAESCALSWAYYKGVQYSPAFLRLDANNVAQSIEMGAQLQSNKKLWSGIKSVVSAVPTAVDVDRRLCYKKARPLPVKRGSAFEARLTAKWEQDRWRRRTKLSPLYGAVMGNSYKRVIPGELTGDDTAPSRLAVYSPEIMTVLRDQHNHNNLIAAKIEYRYSEAMDNQNPRDDILGTLNSYQSIQNWQSSQALGITAGEQIHTYTMVITEDAYYTFRDHVMYSYDDFLGNSWSNSLGVVPVVDVPFNDIGEDLGLPTFYSVLPQLDALNELMSMAGTILKNYADPIVIVYNAPPGFSISKSLKEGEANAIYIKPRPNFTGQVQPEPKIEYLELKGSGLSGLLEWVQQTKIDVDAALPEMQMKGIGSLSGSGHERELTMQGLIDKIMEIRETHFDADEDAIQMALVADDARGEELTPDEGRARIEQARSDYDLRIVADTVLERDRATESQIISVSIADGVMSQFTGRLTMGMTYSEAVEEQQRIDDEFNNELGRQKQWLQLQKDFGITPTMLPTQRDLQLMAGNALSLGNGGSGGAKNSGGPVGGNPNATRQTRPGGGVPNANPAMKGQSGTRGGNPNN